MVQGLQRDLDNITDWGDTWFVKLNNEKCEVMHIGKENEHNDYYLNCGGERNILGSASTQRDLGVHFSSDLNWTPL